MLYSGLELSQIVLFYVHMHTQTDISDRHMGVYTYGTLHHLSLSPLQMFKLSQADQQIPAGHKYKEGRRVDGWVCGGCPLGETVRTLRIKQRQEARTSIYTHPVPYSLAKQ